MKSKQVSVESFNLPSGELRGTVNTLEQSIRKAQVEASEEGPDYDFEQYGSIQAGIGLRPHLELARIVRAQRDGLSKVWRVLSTDNGQPRLLRQPHSKPKQP